MPCSRASRTSRSRDRCISLAAVGKAIAFSCTVVSTVTRSRSFSRSAPTRWATARLSWNTFSKPSGPIRSRHRVIDERSMGSSC